jgi:hypothetical protein
MRMIDNREEVAERLEALMVSMLDPGEENLNALQFAINELREPTCCMCGDPVKYYHCNEDST